MNSVLKIKGYGEYLEMEMAMIADGFVWTFGCQSCPEMITAAPISAKEFLTQLTAKPKQKNLDSFHGKRRMLRHVSV